VTNEREHPLTKSVDAIKQAPKIEQRDTVFPPMKLFDKRQRSMNNSDSVPRFATVPELCEEYMKKTCRWP
jgi:hypothetical protein